MNKVLNDLYLPQTGNNMASKTYKWNQGSFSIGDFHLGLLGTTWSVHNSKVIHELKAKDFDAAKTEAYDFVFNYCIQHRMIPPAKPTN